MSHYSLIFLIGSAILLIVHIPLLDRAERSRKEFLVGGTRAAVVRTGLGGGTMLHLLADVPLFDQGAVQFILLTVMIVVVAFLIWLTIPR